MSKYKASAPSRANTASSIRGKISAPIPIPDDEEFPIRAPGTGIATPVGNEGADKHLPSPIGIHQTGIAVSDFSEVRNPSSQRSYTEGPLPPRHILQTNVRNSQISQPTDRSSIEKPQRKKTSLKSVLGRIFGTKKGRNGASRSSNRTSITARTDQHRSDPSALGRNKPESPSQSRSTSLPINEYNRALRSHSPFTETFPLQNPSENRSSTLAERRARTRRATTPSRIFEPSAEHRDNGLAPRPASSHARDSRLFTDDGDRGGIGCAVTSGSHPNRRSRSLDGLRHAIRTRAQSTTRRRSDEIKYWRQSYEIDALSPVSSTKGEQELQDAAHHEENTQAQEMEPAEENVAPQPFNFGPMGEMAGMKITEAASLETRVTRMEKKMNQMEKIIFQMQSRSASSGSNIQDSQKGPISRGSSSGKKPADESSLYSLPRPVDRFRAKESEQRSSSNNRPSIDTQNSIIDSYTSRPLSTSTTIRGLPSSPPLPSDKDLNQLSGERYNKLVSFITNEQQARLRLEVVVDQLQTQLQEQIRIQSSRPTSLETHHPNAHFLQYYQGGPEPYPTPSPDHHNVSTQKNQQAPQSTFEADDSSDDETNPNEVFRTPNEEVSHYNLDPDHDFGTDPEEDEDERHGKRAVRITSLSQMTLGKGRGGLPSVNF